MPRNWEELKDEDKIDALTKVLTKAGSDMDFRDCCLVSAISARAAVEKEADVVLPTDMRVQFVTEDEAKRTLILRLPEYNEGQEIPVEADQFNWPCTYTIYKPETKNGNG